ncbi:hypothetical protein CO678_19250 [Bradyrhizobium diazoefficiens]|nr:hypothetical protein CO678_19250 [Bradyrhizobium diazoefficiens]
MHLATAGDSQRQRQLHADRAAQLAFDEIAQRLRNIAALVVDAALQLARDLLGYVARPLAPS